MEAALEPGTVEVILVTVGSCGLVHSQEQSKLRKANLKPNINFLMSNAQDIILVGDSVAAGYCSLMDAAQWSGRCKATLCIKPLDTSEGNGNRGSI